MIMGHNLKGPPWIKSLRSKEEGSGEISRKLIQLFKKELIV